MDFSHPGFVIRPPVVSGSFRRGVFRRGVVSNAAAVPRPRPASQALALLASCMTQRLKTAKPLGIKGAPLSLSGGMDEETTAVKLQSP